MKIITHENLWWWGKSYTMIADDGKSMIELAIEDDEERNYFGTIQSLLVHESVRQQGRGNVMLMFAEEKAKKLGLKQVVLCARKGTFLIPWYQRNGYEIYDENPEYSKGQTVAMNKYFEDKEQGTMGNNDDLKVIPLDASTVRIPVEPLGAVTEDELNKRIHELFVKYCCGGIDNPEDEMPHYVKVCREVFTNGYKAGYQDMLRNVTGKEWEK